MKDKGKDNVKGSDVLIWVLIALMAGAVIFAQNYYISTFSVKIAAWAAWLVLSGVLFIRTATGNSAVQFVKESRIELRKVVWPTKQETVQMTLTIMVVVAIVSLLLWAVDSGLMWAVGKVTQLDR